MDPYRKELFKVSKELKSEEVEDLKFLNKCGDGEKESIKRPLDLFNLLLALAGLAIIGVGAYIQIGAKHYLDFLDSTYLNTPIVFIIVGQIHFNINIVIHQVISGIVIFLISFLACCGSLSEKSCMVYIYSGLMVTILLAQFGPPSLPSG